MGQRKRLITKYKTRRTGKIENPEKSRLKRPLGAEILVFLFTNRRVLIVNKPILNEIQSGEFAKEWMIEHRSGQTKFKTMRKKHADHPIEEIGEKLRKLMPWIAEQKMVDKSKN